MLKKNMKQIFSTLLPRKFKRDLVSLAFNLDRDRFQELATQYLFAPHMERGLRALASRPFAPETILDIGAFEGDWAKMARCIWPSSKLVMIEGNPQKIPIILSNKQIADATVINALIGSEDGREVPFYVMESGSSVFEEHSPLERTQTTLPLRKLDTVMEQLPKPDFIKIDVQGYELEVLKGGVATFAAAKAILIELSLIEINEGAPLLNEALGCMSDIGFVAYDILEIHRRPLDGAMNQIDVLFVPRSSPWRSDKRHFA